MPRWARVWECNYDQFECCGRPFWISLIQRRWVPRTRRAHKRTSSVFVLMGRLSTDETGACCVTASPLGSFNTTEVAGWNKTNFPLLTVSEYKVVWIILLPAIKYGVLHAELALTHQKTLNSVTVSLQLTNPLFLEPPLPSCDSVFISYKLLSSLYSCPSPDKCVYSSFLSPCREAEIQLLECVARYTSRLARCILAERSVGHAIPHRCL